MFKLLKTEGHARRGEFITPHGTVQTPAFFPYPKKQDGRPNSRPAP